MEYINKATGHTIKTTQRVVKFPAVFDAKGHQISYEKARIPSSITPEEFAQAGYVQVEVPEVYDQLSEIKWDGDRAYREAVIIEDIEEPPDLERLN